MASSRELLARRLAPCKPVPVSYTHLDVYKRQVYTWQFAPGSFLNVVWKNAAVEGNQEVAGDYFKNVRHTMQADDNNNLSLKVIYFLDYLQLRKNKKKAI